MSSTRVPQNAPITLTPSAIEATLLQQRDHQQWQDKVLRLYLDGKGCDGFYYGVTFDAPTEQDLSFIQDKGVAVVVDPETYRFVRGSHIDWVDDARGKGYLVHNPRHSQFRGKFFKREVWQKALANETKI